jgi:hypothetical protein
MVMFKEFAIPLGLAASPETNSMSFRLTWRGVPLITCVQTAKKRPPLSPGPLCRDSRRFAHETTPKTTGLGDSHRERRHTNRYNETLTRHTQMKRQAERGSRNSKTTDRLSGGTVGNHCRHRHRESVPHITSGEASARPIRKSGRGATHRGPHQAGGRARHRGHTLTNDGRGRLAGMSPVTAEWAAFVSSEPEEP